MKSNPFKNRAFAAAAIVAVSVIGCDQPTTLKAEPAKDQTAQSTSEQGTDKVSAALKGKLIGLKDGEIAEAQLTGNPQYYVLYHSASW
ncbi:MAG: hypothetical protein VCA55_15080 [Verrucomicrobiales bacterium]